MKDDTRLWLKYAEENLDSAKILLDSELFNPCLQNVQQAVEKILKALIMEMGIPLIRTQGIYVREEFLKTLKSQLSLVRFK